METTNPLSFQNWIPNRLIKQEKILCLEWIFLGDVLFTKPFFDETITACIQANSMALVKSEKRLTTLDFLIDIAETLETIPPALIIFHTSRCGSTLTTQLLCLDAENIVVPEYDIIDAILRINMEEMQVPEFHRFKLLKSIIRVIGQKRNAFQQRLIIKLDCWHFKFFNEIRNIYPDSKIAVLFRDPDSIINSHQKKPGMQFIPGLIPYACFDINYSPDHPFSLEKYFNLVLESMYFSIEHIGIEHKEVILLDYNDGMKQNFDEILAAIDITSNKINNIEIEKRLNYHSKNPNENYMHYEIIQNPWITDRTRSFHHRIVRFKDCEKQ